MLDNTHRRSLHALLIFLTHLAALSLHCEATVESTITAEEAMDDVTAEPDVESSPDSDNADPSAMDGDTRTEELVDTLDDRESPEETGPPDADEPEIGDSSMDDGESGDGDPIEDTIPDGEEEPLPSEGCASGSGQTVENARLTLTSGTRQREYLLDVPASYDGHPVPLVMNFHGMGSDATQQRLYTGMADKAVQEDFIVTHPEGLLRNWNIAQPAEDVQFVRDLQDALMAEYCIDTRRVYAVGMSNGATFVHLLGCMIPDRFSAIAPISGNNLGLHSCVADALIPVFQAHGTADAIVPFSLGEDAHEYWLEQNQCSDHPVELPNGCQYWSECTGDADVVWCVFEGVGHIRIWMTDFPLTDELWSFLETHRLPH